MLYSVEIISLVRPYTLRGNENPVASSIRVELQIDEHAKSRPSRSSKGEVQLESAEELRHSWKVASSRDLCFQDWKRERLTVFVPRRHSDRLTELIFTREP